MCKLYMIKVGFIYLYVNCAKMSIHRFRVLAGHFQTMYPNLNIDVDAELEQLKVTTFISIVVASFNVICKMCCLNILFNISRI